MVVYIKTEDPLDIVPSLYRSYIARYLFHVSLSLCLRRNSIFCLITLAQRERERERRGFLPFLLLPSNSECSDRLRTHLGCVYPLCFSLSLSVLFSFLLLLWQKISQKPQRGVETFSPEFPGNRVSHRIAQLL